MASKKKTRKKAAKKTAKRKPSKKEPNGDRDESGRFAPGWKGGPGRPKGIDFKMAVAKHAEAEGIDMHEAVWEVSQALFKRAQAGDTAAAKLWLDRCCGIQSQHLDVNATSTVYMADEDNAAMKAMMADPVIQAAMRAEAKRRTDG